MRLLGGSLSNHIVSSLRQNTMKALITHKRATFDFELLETFEAGVSLLGTEVKSVRSGQGKLEGGHVVIRGNEAFLVGTSIPAYQKANAPKGYDAERPRKLLLSQKEIRHLEEKSEKQGLTIVPIKLYNKDGKLKLEIAVAKGKKKHDKRESIKARDTKRDIERELKN
jgi:SsrA-binding protein